MTNPHFDFDRPIDRVQYDSFKWCRYPKDILPMWVADMDYATSPAIQAALKKEIEHGVLGYCWHKPVLVEVVIERLQRIYNWSVQADWLVWLPGVVAGLAASVRTVGEEGQAILVNTPIYHHFLSIPEQAKRRLNCVPLHCVEGRWTFDFDAIRAAISDQTRLFFLCNPHNPVGTVYRKDELEMLTEICSENNLVICSDDIHCDLILDRQLQHVPIAQACPEYQHRTITLMAPSKTFNLAGVNASFAIIPDSTLRRQFRAQIDHILPLTTAMAYTAAIAAYRDSEHWHTELLGYLRRNRDTLEAAIAEIPELSMTHVEATYLGWIDTSRLATDDAHGLFLKYGLGFSNGLDFGDANFQRINFACTYSNLLEAIRRIKAAVESCRSTH